MPSNDPYAMNSYIRRGGMEPFPGGGGGAGAMNQPNAAQFPGGNHPPGAPMLDQNR